MAESTSLGVRSLRVGAGLSTRSSALSATEEALRAALLPLRGEAPDLAFLFVAPQFEDELEAIVESANASLGGGLLLGCVAGGVIGGRSEVEDAPAVAAWAATLPGVNIRPFELTYAEEPEHGVFEGLEEVPTREPASVLVMLADPYTFPAHLLLDHLNEHAPNLPIVGGMASGGVVEGRTRLIISDMVEVGQTIQFQVRDAESAREDLRETLEHERDGAKGPVAGALLFSCNGRGEALFGRPDHDVGAVHSAFGDIPVAGFFAAGERGPAGGATFLRGFTPSVLL